MPRRDQKVINVFTRADITRLLAACARPAGDHYPWLAERDKTLIMLLLDTGIRASEVCELTLAEHACGWANPYIKVFGKGRKERRVGLGVRARQRLHRWIYRYRRRTGLPDRLCGPRPAAAGQEGLEALLRRLKEETGITGVRCSAHDFRHTFAFTFLANGGDVMRLSRLLGHTSLAVTLWLPGGVSVARRPARRGDVLDSMNA